LSTLGARTFPSWDDLCHGVVEAALHCLAANGAFLAQFEPGSEWMTMLATTPALLKRSSLQIPTLANLDRQARVFQVGPNAADEALQTWCTRMFPSATSLLGVPIPGADATPYGVLGIFHHETAVYQGADVAVLQLLAQRVTREIERHREQQSREQLTERLEQASTFHHTLQMEISHLLQVKTDLRFLMNHEFRNALTCVQGFSEIIRDEPCTPEEIHMYAAEIVIAASRLDRMTQELLGMEHMPVASIEQALDVMDHQDIREHVLHHVRSRRLPRALPQG
jgi:GAF domain-containing protein